MPYAILRLEKRKGQQTAAINKHHERTKETYGSNPDIDHTRSKLNYHLIQPKHFYRKEIDDRIRAAGCKVRKDSVKFIDVLIGATPDFINKLPEEDIHEYFGLALKFVEDEVGAQNIFSAVVHRDERTQQRSNGSWEARYLAGYDEQTGKPIRRSAYGKTRTEAKNKMLEALADLQNGVYVAPNKIKLGEWLDIWLATYAKTSVRPTTFAQYEGLLRNHVPEGMKARAVQDIRPHEIQRLYTELLESGFIPQKKKEHPVIVRPEGYVKPGPKPRPRPPKPEPRKGLSPATVRHMHVVLKMVFGQAVREGFIKVNPVDSCVPPKKVKPQIKTLPVEDIPRLFEEAAKTRMYAAYLLDFVSGLRKGELLGLMWKDINMEDNYIYIHQQVTRTKSDIEIMDVKTVHSRRHIGIPPLVTAELKRHHRRQLEERLQAGAAYTDMDLVFPNEFGTPQDPSAFYRGYRRMLERAQIEPIRFHDIRHTFATLALREGATVKDVQVALGHGSASFTLETYIHETGLIQRETANKMQGVLENVLPGVGRGR